MPNVSFLRFLMPFVTFLGFCEIVCNHLLQSAAALRYSSGMTKDEKRRASLARIRESSAQLTDGVAAGVGGYIAGRFARNSQLYGVPLPLVAGGVGLFLKRKGRGSGTTRKGAMALIGMGAYGAGKMGEKHGEAAGNDGNLFSFGSDGFSTD